MSGVQPPPGGPPVDLPPPSALTVTEVRAGLAHPTRLSPLGPLFLFFTSLRKIGIWNLGFLGAFTLSGGRVWLIGVAAVLMLVLAAVRWWRFTYQVVGDELIVTSGLVALERTVVPLERVQAVSTRENLLHRMTGLVQASIETAGSTGSEVELSAVKLEVAESLRQLTTSTATSTSSQDSPGANGSAHAVSSEAADTSADQVLLRRSVRDLVVVGVLRSAVTAAAAGAVVFGSAIQLAQLFDTSAGGFLDGVFSSPVRVVAAVVGFLPLLLIVSVALNVMRLYELTLTSTTGGLRSQQGLVSRSEKVVSRERIQFFTSVQNPIERRFGIRQITLPTAAQNRANNAQASSGEMLLPGTTDGEARELAGLVAGEAIPAHRLPNGISRHAIVRWVLWLGVVPALVVVLGLWSLLGPWVLVATLWILLVVPMAFLTHARWRWQVTDEVLHVSKGRFSERIQLMPVRKAQSVELARQLFHLRRDLASVHVSTAAGTIVVPHLPLAQARHLRDTLLYRVETDPRPFM